ncbi:MAG: response regulator [Anaerolineales bacterium]|nr:response regulator [Anaerolineales bacterium]
MKRVLVVDDEIGALTLIGIMLERGGFEVLKAQHAREALHLLDMEGAPDIFILDVMMPEIDGIQLCRMLREREETKDVPVLILSARSDAKSVIQGMEAGATDYILKPIFHHNLVEKVRNLLNMGATAD